MTSEKFNDSYKESDEFMDLRSRQAIFESPAAAKTPDSTQWPTTLIKLLGKNASGGALSKLQQSRKYFFTQNQTLICERLVFTSQLDYNMGPTSYTSLSIVKPKFQVGGKLLVPAFVSRERILDFIENYKNWNLLKRFL